MTLRFCDSFAHYSSAQWQRKWTGATNNGLANSTPGRYGAGSWCMASGGGERDGRWVTVGASMATTVVGFGFFWPGRAGQVCATLDGGSIQVALGVDAAGHLQAWLGGYGNVLLGSSAALLRAGAWSSVELKTLCDPAAGTFVARVNGVTVLSLAGQNTRSTGNSWANGVGFLGSPQNSNGPGAASVSDVYVCDGLGAANNDFLGDVRVQALMPTGPGAYTEFSTLVGAATQWQACAEAPADDDTSYVGSATAGQRSTFATAGITPASGTVAAVVVNHTSRKDDAGARAVAGMARSAGVDAAAAGASVGNSYLVYQDIMETDPSGAAWTIASVNAAEFGVKEIA